MTEYEKMISGELYFALDAELVCMRAKARNLLDKINASVQDVKKGERLDFCHQLFGKVGSGLWLQPPFYCDYGKNIELGDHFYCNFNCVILDVAKVIIGSNVLLGRSALGPNVQIYTAGNPLDSQLRSEGPEFGKSVRIGHSVWIGGSAVICPGVTIGDVSVIAAGAIVMRAVPSKVVVGGIRLKSLKN